MDTINLWTIGFTQKPARRFFELLRASGAKRIVDVRLNNVSQLAGFAKRDDLQFFAREICAMDYVHVPELAPTAELFDRYKKADGDWDEFAERFLELMRQRRVEERVPAEIFRDGCLLCSEHQPHHCHRRLVAEYLGAKWGAEMRVEHLV